MLKDLGEVTLIRAGSYPAFYEALQSAFRRYGLDVTSLPPAQAVSTIRASAIRKDLVAALDEWANQLGPGDELRSRLVSITKQLDVHPLRNAIRDATVRNDRDELNRLLRQLVGVMDISEYPATWLSAIGNFFIGRGDPDAAITLLVPAQRIYPNHFFVNSKLGYACRLSRPPRYNEAIRFQSIAVALRPTLLWTMSCLVRTCERAGTWTGPERVRANHRNSA